MLKTFSASLDQLYSMLAFIREQTIARGFSLPNIALIELACEEVLVNIISYAYPSFKGELTILCSSFDKGITIIFRDQGIAYDPLTSISLKRSSLSDKERLGGYGVELIVKIMDKVYYTREGPNNVLTLIKYSSGNYK